MQTGILSSKKELLAQRLVLIALLWFGFCEYAAAKVFDRPDLGITAVYWGRASYYGRYFHGRKTASGERFDMHKLTAAHRKFALGTIVKVTNLDNGKYVVVVINDRGPYVKGRSIDLSRGAAKKIGMIRKGVVRVKIEKLS